MLVKIVVKGQLNGAWQYGPFPSHRMGGMRPATYKLSCAACPFYLLVYLLIRML